MNNPYAEPIETCPYCKNDMYASFVDNGVGSVQCGPYYCESCGASEIGPEMGDWYYRTRNNDFLTLPGKRRYSPYAKKKLQGFGKLVLRHGHPFSDKEVETGYYQGKHSPYANTVGGELVNDELSHLAYRLGILDEKDLPETDTTSTKQEESL